mmetsp:Transcript_17140/g.24224  ORF Transcript_17140/g.24224 Transcript_17140/m.24224 type:complete len:219 (+) Transcript_17140:2666-3322(+)
MNEPNQIIDEEQPGANNCAELVDDLLHMIEDSDVESNGNHPSEDDADLFDDDNEFVSADDNATGIEECEEVESNEDEASIEREPNDAEVGVNKVDKEQEWTQVTKGSKDSTVQIEMDPSLLPQNEDGSGIDDGEQGDTSKEISNKATKETMEIPIKMELPTTTTHSGRSVAKHEYSIMTKKGLTLLQGKRVSRTKLAKGKMNKFTLPLKMTSEKCPEQ